MRNEIFRTSRIERWGFALFMAGQGIVNTYVGSYLQLYLTDIGITAVAVGVMFLIARVWDAVNDPIFGAILDKLNLKGGKFLPFLRASNIMLPQHGVKCHRDAYYHGGGSPTVSDHRGDGRGRDCGSVGRGTDVFHEPFFQRTLY